MHQRLVGCEGETQSFKSSVISVVELLMRQVLDDDSNVVREQDVQAAAKILVWLWKLSKL